MKWRALALAAVVAAGAGSSQSCSTTTTPADPEPCANGEGHWIEDDNDWLTAETHVTVRLCVSENGQVLDIEVQ